MTGLPGVSGIIIGTTAAAGKIINATTTKVFLSTTTRTTGSGGTAGFQTVGCVGLGLMGHGICQVAASSGVHSKVIAYEKEQRFLDAGYVCQRRY
jgi:3-hydroxyacyl-CoA dehydrogenase, NAD binding domain